MATDVELFAEYFFPHYCTAAFNEFHEDTFDDYEFEERAVRRADAAPRGYAKSVIKAVIKPIHDLCYGLEHFIVIISNTEDQALQKIKDIREELLENDLLADFFGPFFRMRRPAETDFIAFSGDHSCRFLGLGFKKEIRGIRYGAHRPSKIVGDDLEHSDEVENESLRTKYSNRYQDVLTKIGDPQTNIEIIGTVLHRKALLSDLLRNPRYRGRTYTAVISWATRKDLWEKWRQIYTNLEEDDRRDQARAFYESNRAEMEKGAKVLWPERESYYFLQEEIIETGLRSFMKEKQNKPMSDDEKIFDMDAAQWFVETLGRHPQTGAMVPGIKFEKGDAFYPFDQLRPFVAMDPSTGQDKPKMNKKGDYTCLLTGYQDPKGRLLVFNDFTKRVAPSKYITQLFEQHDDYIYEKVGVETNLYRNLLLPNIIAERKRREKERGKIIKLPLYDIEQVENKNKRIYTLEPKVHNGWICFNRTLSEEFVDQMRDFPKADHDDCCDALEMLWGLTNNRFKPVPVQISPMDR